MFILCHTSASLPCNSVLQPQSAVSNRQHNYTVSSSTDMSRTGDFPRRNCFYRPYRTGSTDRTGLFIQTVQNCFYRPHRTVSTDRTGLFIQTAQDCSYRPTRLVLQTAQNWFYRSHRTVYTDRTGLFLQTAQDCFYRPHRTVSTKRTEQNCVYICCSSFVLFLASHSWCV